MKRNTCEAFIKSYKIYRSLHFPITFHILLLVFICSIPLFVFSMHYWLSSNKLLIVRFSSKKVMTFTTRVYNNIQFTSNTLTLLFVLVYYSWLAVLLHVSGDIHPNPGPISATSSVSSMTSTPSEINHIQNHLSFVHLNVQSIEHKLDILFSELCDFDILAFSETWLKSSISTEDLLLSSYHSPERKDRIGDAHGGVILYIKDNIHYKRRIDLELNRLECIWIELILCNNRHILFSIFYRPPNSDVIYNNLIEDSIGLAIDTNIPDIIITGDFNLNVNCYSSNRKITSITQQFNLEQLIDEPTHYTEHSNSLIDLILVSNKSNVIHSGVGDHFLEQELRYHVPIFGFLKFRKPRQMCFDRIVWEYEHADYEALREDINTYTWENCFDADVNIYANNVINQIQTIAKNNIPNKLIKVRPLDVPWMTNSIRVNIRKRKRLYKKARMTNSQYYWQRFKSIRNETILLIREAKSNYFCKLSNKLKNESLSSKDWWKTLKSFISSTNNSSIPPLTDPLNRNIVYSNNDKANLLNNFFVEQMSINDENRDPPYLSSPLSCLNDIVLSPHEVKDVLLSLQVDKAVGPDK